MHVCFVCSGNICRSPMAASVFRRRASEQGLTVRVTSAGIGPWHAGQSADPRAAAALVSRGYPTEHVAAQVDDTHLAADLLLAMDSSHYDDLRRLVKASGGDPSKVRMFRSFDPAAGEDLDVPDPYFGGRNGFDTLLTMIEDAMPGLLRWVRDHDESD